MVDVLLVTCKDLPHGEPGGDVLGEAIAELGHTSRWVVWDDPAVDWAEGRVVAVRSTWDYIDDPKAFLEWAHAVQKTTNLLNGASVFEWNTDKQYLVELSAAGVPIVPTRTVDEREDLVAAAASIEGRVLIKPRVGAGGMGVVVVDDPDDLADTGGIDVGTGPWVVQPVVESVRTEGELSLFLLGGEPTYQVRKLPAGAELRVHEHLGGTYAVVPVDSELLQLSRTCVAAVEGLLGATLDYARVDALRLSSGELVVSELEATEPGLYLDILPDNARAFAVVLDRLLDGAAVR